MLTRTRNGAFRLWCKQSQLGVDSLVYEKAFSVESLARSPLLLHLSGSLKVKVAQLCPTLCDPVDYTVHGILHARILEWVAIRFSRGHLPSPGVELK